VATFSCCINSCAHQPTNGTKNDDSPVFICNWEWRYIGSGKLEELREFTVGAKERPNNTQVHNAFAFFNTKN